MVARLRGGVFTQTGQPRIQIALSDHVSRLRHAVCGLKVWTDLYCHESRISQPSRPVYPQPTDEWYSCTGETDGVFTTYHNYTDKLAAQQQICSADSATEAETCAIGHHPTHFLQVAKSTNVSFSCCRSTAHLRFSVATPRRSYWGLRLVNTIWAYIDWQ